MIMQFDNDKLSVIIAIGIVVFCFAIEFIYKVSKKKTGFDNG